MYYIGSENFTECKIMNITLAANSKPWFDDSTCCLQTERMRRDRAFSDKNGNNFLLRPSDYQDKYRSVTLPQKVSAFFLSICCHGRVIPLESKDRIYIVDDKDGFPPGLAECAIELRKKNIWVVQSRSRASRQVEVVHVTLKKQVCDCYVKVHSIREHDNIAGKILPNTRDELKETFQDNAYSSPLCALMASHPEVIQRCVCEGFFYARPPKLREPHMQEVTARSWESVICAFCKEESTFKTCNTKELITIQHNATRGWQIVEAHLNDKIKHKNGCRFREFCNDDALLKVSDHAGNIMPTQMYYIADPVNESTGNFDDYGKSCSYTQVFVMADISEQERRQLVISHDEINKLIYQQHQEALRTLPHESTATLTTALENYEQVLNQELPLKYHRLYDCSELKRAVSSYRNKLQQLPGPVTRLRQKVLDFLADADTPLLALYVASSQLTHMLPLTRGARAEVLTILTPKISELVAQYRQAMQAVHGQIIIPDLTTMVPCDLWDSHALRETGVVGNEVLDYLNRLNIDDNELYQAFMAHQLNNSC